jgi:hypothetical protein
VINIPTLIYYKERRNLEHYNNVSILRVTEVGICIILVL